MKKTIIALLVICGMTTFFLARGMDDSGSAKKSQEEMEIMKGILNTTLSYAAQNLKRQAKSTASSKTSTVVGASLRQYSNINAFRLAGQGAVFVIPTANLGFPGQDINPFSSGEDLSSQLESLNTNPWSLSTGVASKAAAFPAPAPNREGDLKKKLEEVQAKMQKRREEEAANREKFLQNLAEIKGYLIETLANYGDSFTTIKLDEYINLVFTTDSGFSSDRDQSQYQVISVKRSWITDYKTGKLTLDGFKQKVLNYSE